MKKMTRVLFLIFMILEPSRTNAQQTEERILLPIVTTSTPAPGAFGSLWAVEVKINAREGDVRFIEFSMCFACPPSYVIQAGTTISPPIYPRPLAGSPPGRFIYLERATAQYAHFNVRLHDVSRSFSTWGTEIPVVRERDFITGHLTLINIPTDGRFRQALRIYDADGVLATRFRIRLEEEQTGELITEEARDAIPPPPPGPTLTTPYDPSGVEITSLLATYPQISLVDRIRITITPENSTTRFWAFVSITNNETQEVTLITPQ